MKLNRPVLTVPHRKSLLKRTLFPALALLVTFPAHAQIFTENFDSVAALAGQGWVFTNHSQSPNGLWGQGNPSGAFPAQAGAPNAYAAVNFQSTNASVGTISNWLLTPTLSLQNGDVISFYTRTVTNSAYPDRLELRLSTSAASVNVGSEPTSVGDFSTLLVSINPNLIVGGYPTEWMLYTVTLSGLTGTVEGRIGFRYFVTNGGSSGTNSNFIGLDTLQVTAAAVPEPATVAIATAALLGGVILLRRRASSRM